MTTNDNDKPSGKVWKVFLKLFLSRRQGKSIGNEEARLSGKANCDDGRKDNTIKELSPKSGRKQLAAPMIESQPARKRLFRLLTKEQQQEYEQCGGITFSTKNHRYHVVGDYNYGITEIDKHDKPIRQFCYHSETHVAEDTILHQMIHMMGNEEDYWGHSLKRDMDFRYDYSAEP